MKRVNCFAGLALLVASASPIAEAQEPLSNINTHMFSDSDPSVADIPFLAISSDAAFKVIFCATNKGNRAVEMNVVQFRKGSQDNSSWVNFVPKQDTKCVPLGGQEGEFFQVFYGPSGTMDFAITTETTAGGDVKVGPCESGGIGPFNCDLLQDKCALDTIDIAMFWPSCGGDLDCYEAIDDDDGQLYRWLRLPSTGPVYKESHLVTIDEDFAGFGWPVSATNGISRHYEISEAVSGYSAIRTQPWSPAGEGGSEWGQGATGAKVPVMDEAWYINMYWRNRPSVGTRMIVIEPATQRAVVASAGLDTGPGSNTAIAGVAEEIHHYLGTSHRSELLIGFASDQSLPLGPIDCP